MLTKFKIAGVALALPLLAGCGDPLAEVDKLSDVELAEDAPQADLVAPPSESETPVAKPGLFQGIFGGKPAERGAASEAGAPGERSPDVALPAPQAPPSAPAPVEAEEKPRGFLGLFSKNSSKAAGDAAPGQAPATAAALAVPPPATVKEKPASKPATRGLFGRSGSSQPKSKQPVSVPPGTLLSFGLIKPVCNLPRNKRGKETGAFPKRGKVWRLYDTDPSKTTPHPFYITGFEDGCARTFTAAVAVFGAPSMHELLRYGLPSEVQPYSATDRAYEVIKSRICKVARRKPCGTKVSRLEKNTVFVSAYENYGNNGRWFNVLLHDGKVAETDIKGGG